MEVTEGVKHHDIFASRIRVRDVLMDYLANVCKPCGIHPIAAEENQRLNVLGYESDVFADFICEFGAVAANVSQCFESVLQANLSDLGVEVQNLARLMDWEIRSIAAFLVALADCIEKGLLEDKGETHIQRDDRFADACWSGEKELAAFRE